MCIGVLDIKDVATLKPCLIHDIILCIAHPGRGKDLGTLLGTTELCGTCLKGARLDEISIFASNTLDSDAIFGSIAPSHRSVILCSQKM